MMSCPAHGAWQRDSAALNGSRQGSGTFELHWRRQLEPEEGQAQKQDQNPGIVVSPRKTSPGVALKHWKHEVVTPARTGPALPSRSGKPVGHEGPFATGVGSVSGVSPPLASQHPVTAATATNPIAALRMRAMAKKYSGIGAGGHRGATWCVLPDFIARQAWRRWSPVRTRNRSDWRPMPRPPSDDTHLLARLRESEAIVAAQRDEAGTAQRLANASRDEALRLIEWIDEWHGPSAILEQQFCRLVDLGDEALSYAIFAATTISPKNEGLIDRATAALDSPSPNLRAAALSALGMSGDVDLLAIPGLHDKIASLASDADDRVRGCVAFALGACSPDVVAPMLEDPSDHVRYAALSMLVDVPEYARLAESVALRLVLDPRAERGPRLDAADFLRTEDERRAAHAFLASQGIGDAPKPGDRFFSGAQRRGEVN
jgi:hypothetical protein